MRPGAACGSRPVYLRSMRALLFSGSALSASLVLSLLFTGCGDAGSSTASGGAPVGGSVTSSAGGGGAATTTGAAGGGGAPATTSSAGGSGGALPSGGSGGAPATGGSGGALPAGGSGGAPATTTTTTTTGAGMNTPCVWGDDCGPGQYCFAPGCGSGTCIQKPVPAGQSPDPAPVCGCDGATYWNADVAASQGMSVASDAACASPIPCGPGAPCPGTMKCDRQVPDQPACGPQVTGECWGTPLSCPLDGPQGRACSNDKCELRCSLIQSQNPWFDDPTCN